MKPLFALLAIVGAMLVSIVPAQADPASVNSSCNTYGGLPPGPPSHDAGTISVTPSNNANYHAGGTTNNVPGPCEAPGWNKTQGP